MHPYVPRSAHQSDGGGNQKSTLARFDHFVAGKILGLDPLTERNLVNATKPEKRAVVVYLLSEEIVTDAIQKYMTPNTPLNDKLKPMVKQQTEPNHLDEYFYRIQSAMMGLAKHELQAGMVSPAEADEWGFGHTRTKEQYKEQLTKALADAGLDPVLDTLAVERALRKARTHLLKDQLGITPISPSL